MKTMCSTESLLYTIRLRLSPILLAIAPNISQILIIDSNAPYLLNN